MEVTCSPRVRHLKTSPKNPCWGLGSLVQVVGEWPALGWVTVPEGPRGSVLCSGMGLMTPHALVCPGEQPVRGTKFRRKKK